MSVRHESVSQCIVVVLWLSMTRSSPGCERTGAIVLRRQGLLQAFSLRLTAALDERRLWRLDSLAIRVDCACRQKGGQPGQVVSVDQIDVGLPKCLPHRWVIRGRPETEAAAFRMCLGDDFSQP